MATLTSTRRRSRSKTIAPRLRPDVSLPDPEAKIFIRGDCEALHGNVTRLLDQIRSSGFTKISFEIKSQAAAGVPVPGRQDSKTYGLDHFSISRRRGGRS